jgi:hypothetical protein
MLAAPRHLVLASLIAGLTAGCGGHSSASKKSSSTAAGVSTAAVNSGTTAGVNTGSTSSSSLALEVTGIPLLASQDEQLFVGAPVVALAFTVEATGAQGRLLRVDIASSGTIDESTLGGVELIEDLNGNGEIDAGETSVASAPAALTDDETYVVTPVSPLVFATNTPRSFLVTVDASALSTSDQVNGVGSTLAFAIADAASVIGEDDQGIVVTGSGTFPMNASVIFEVNDTVLLSEICPGPGSQATSAEFIELFNATGATTDLSDYYLTDYTDNPNNGNFHWKLPTGENFGPAGGVSSYDFLVRFPAGTTLTSGQVITVAVDAEGFKAAYGSDPTFCMRNKGTTTAEQMLTWDGVAPGTAFTAAPVHNNASLTGPGSSAIAGGEMVALFSWDGASDLIADVDLVNYGGSSSTNTAVNKSPNQPAQAPGAPDVRVDSLTDADATESVFNDDSTDLFQFDHRAPNGTSISRADFTEGAEIKTGGNGITGNDETSEDFGDGNGANGTFERLSTATPGQLP